MRKFKLNKLVRDGVFSSMQELGQVADHQVVTGEALTKALNDKLVEEADEADVVDLLEVVEQLALAQGMTFEQLRAAQLAKRGKVGGFAAGIFVDTVTVEDDDKWADYYAANPERFPEINIEVTE